MPQSLFERFRVIDIDTHLTEPHDVWTSRVPGKWGDRIPHIERLGGKDVWVVAGTPVGAPGAYSMAGHSGTFPDFPDTYADVPAATYDAEARLAYMDAEGIHAQVLYPNVGGFGSGSFLKLGEPELMRDCVRAYNDFLIDWTRADPERLIPVMATPFWDVPEVIAEIHRSAERGHRAILFCGRPDVFGQPVLSHRHWDPVWAAAQEAGLPVSFHVGAGDLSEVVKDRGEIGTKANFGRASSLTFFDNAHCLAELIFGGVCHRFPALRFVSVESGVGWLSFALEAFDWQWRNSGVIEEHPEYDLLPSEYFARQIYGSFWFEEEGARRALECFPDNLLYETDFPHPTCMAPGPQPFSRHPREYAESVLGNLPEATLRKVLHDNAAALYGVG